MAEPEPSPSPEPSPEEWQHRAISAARDRDWALLRATVLPAGQPRMPDDLLNGRPAVRPMAVLHQIAFAGGDAGGAEPTLRALVAGGCRFDPSIRSSPTGGDDAAERNQTAPQLARARGHAALADLLEQLPDLPPAPAWRYRRGADDWLPFTESDAQIEAAFQAFRNNDGPDQLSVTVSTDTIPRA